MLKKLIISISLIIIIVSSFLMIKYKDIGKKPLARQEAEAPIPIGGDFTLLDTNNNTVSDKDFRGKYMLVYFGFTYCPDICPMSLSNISGALEILGDKSKEIATIFITIDPERDNSAHIASYLKNFSPQIIGLTGSVEEIRKIADNYKVYYAKITGRDQANYQLSHSSFIYLMDKNGKFLKHFAHDTNASEIAAEIKKSI